MTDTKMRIDTEKYKYGRTKVRDKAGKVRHSATNGDAVAKAMMGLTVPQVVDVMNANGLQRFAAYATEKNPGQFRMTIGNSLRGMVRKGTAVTIGPHRIEKLDQNIPVSELTPPPSKAAQG